MSNNIKLQNASYGVNLVLSGEPTYITVPSTDFYVYSGNSQQASNDWLIVHNLNKFCSVTVVDDSNNVVIADVVYIDANSLRVRFASAVTGKAYLN